MQELLIFSLDTLNYILAIVLVALGLVIVFGLMRVINMAHGEFFLLGAYSVVTVQSLGGGFWLGLLVAPLFVACVGLLVEHLVVRFLYHRFLDTILATWGISLVIKQVVILIFGPASQQVGLPIEATFSLPPLPPSLSPSLLSPTLSLSLSPLSLYLSLSLYYCSMYVLFFLNYLVKIFGEYLCLNSREVVLS